MRYKNINKIDCETFACEAHRKQFCTPQAFLCRVLARSMAHSHLTQLAPLTENQELLQLKSEEKPMDRNTINHGPNQKKRGEKNPHPKTAEAEKISWRQRPSVEVDGLNEEEAAEDEALIAFNAPSKGY